MKLRFDVETHRSPGSRCTPPSPGHNPQPGSPHSNPASTKCGRGPLRSQPGRPPGSRGRPGHARRARPCARATCGRGLRSLSRPLVHEPMNTQSIGDARDRAGPASTPCTRAPLPLARVRLVARLGGIGHGAVDRRCCGPGSRPRHLRRDRAGVDVTSRSNWSRPGHWPGAPVFDARSRTGTGGAERRPAPTYSNVMSSGATSPILAPNSTARLQIVIRCSTPSASITDPANSIAWPAPASAPEGADGVQDQVLGFHRRGQAPSKGSASSSGAAGRGSGWRGRGRPRWCRPRTPARRGHRWCRCGCRRRRR